MDDRLLRCDLLPQTDTESSVSFLSAHLNSHFSTLKGSINIGALVYLLSLPSRSFLLLCKKK